MLPPMKLGLHGSVLWTRQILESMDSLTSQGDTMEHILLHDATDAVTSFQYDEDSATVCDQAADYNSDMSMHRCDLPQGIALEDKMDICFSHGLLGGQLGTCCVLPLLSGDALWSTGSLPCGSATAAIFDYYLAPPWIELRQGMDSIAHPLDARGPTEERLHCQQITIVELYLSCTCRWRAT